MNNLVLELHKQEPWYLNKIVGFKRAYGKAGIWNPEPEPETETQPEPELKLIPVWE